MKTNLRMKLTFTIPATLAALVIMLAGNAAAQAQKVQGVINGRSGATLTLQTSAFDHCLRPRSENTPIQKYCGKIP